MPYTVPMVGAIPKATMSLNSRQDSSSFIGYDTYVGLQAKTMVQSANEEIPVICIFRGSYCKRYRQNPLITILGNDHQQPMLIPVIQPGVINLHQSLAVSENFIAFTVGSKRIDVVNCCQCLKCH